MVRLAEDGSDYNPQPKTRNKPKESESTSGANSFVTPQQEEGWGTVIYLTGAAVAQAKSLEDSTMKENGWVSIDDTGNRWQFVGNGQPATTPGALGYGIPNWPSDVPNTATAIGDAISTAAESIPGSSMGVTNAMWQYPNFGDVESMMLVGNRAWINDEPIMDMIVKLSQVSNRDIMSAPNGDFIAFFPDRTGMNGKQPVIKIRDIEVVSLDLKVLDENLYTHLISFGNVPAPIALDALITLPYAGMVTIQMEELMRYLLGLEKDDNVDAVGVWMLSKFGLRPKRVENPHIIDAGWNYCLALHMFQELWASQWLADVSFTFMPEIYPGMRIELADHGLGMYVEGVTHSGSRTGGWTTSAQVSTPMRRVGKTWKMMRAEWPSGILDIGETKDATERTQQSATAADRVLFDINLGPLNFELTESQAATYAQAYLNSVDDGNVSVEDTTGMPTSGEGHPIGGE